MVKIKVSPPYKPLVQLPLCCDVCSLQWVLFRRGYWIDQEEIAWYCKLKVPKKDLKYFVRKMRIAKDKSEEGTSVEKFHTYANKMLKNKNIKLKVEKFLSARLVIQKNLSYEI